MKISPCTISGKKAYLVNYKENGKYRRKYFYSLAEAKNWEKIYRNSNDSNKTALSFSQAQLDDILLALKMLPQNRTLSEAVKIAFSNSTDVSIIDIAELYKLNRTSRGNRSRHIISVKAHVDEFVRYFGSFEKITEKSAFDFLKTKGNARSTLSKWFFDLNDFLKFAIRKDAIKFNPMDKLDINDFGRAKTVSKKKAIEVDKAKTFFNFIQAEYPQYLKYFALTMFSGIRVAEVKRIKECYIDYEAKAIHLPAEITKKNKAEYLDDFEDNLWQWLDIVKGKEIIAPYAKISTALYEKFALPQNFARHSFATYHYSLYRDPRRTAAITHHTEQELMNTYMDALVDKKIAQAFFKILPK